MLELATTGILMRQRGGLWAPAVLMLAGTHLGLLGERRTLGWANRATLARALLPALAPRFRGAGLVALGSDLIDGWIARLEGPATFGGFADPLADVAFWSWFGLRHDGDPRLRWAPVLTLAVPAAAITISYFARGGVVDHPRPILYRHATGVLQLLLAIRGVWRT